VVLRRLAVFVGYFTIEAALAVVPSTTVDQAVVFGVVDSLIAKSMVAAHPVGAMMRYRLLDTTRAYALSMSLDDAEVADLAMRQAVHRIIADVTKDVERWSYNTAVAHCMELLNLVQRYGRGSGTDTGAATNAGRAAAKDGGLPVIFVGGVEFLIVDHFAGRGMVQSQIQPIAGLRGNHRFEMRRLHGRGGNRRGRLRSDLDFRLRRFG